MTFDEILAQITDLLKRQGRVSYGALKRRYDLDDAYLEDLQDEIIHAQRLMELVPLYKVIGTLPRRSPIASRSERPLSPFVGRERELATLEAVFAQVETGSGQVVGIVAEAGGGKSRLLYEFRQRLQDKRVT
jgi:hypothetical protein